VKNYISFYNLSEYDAMALTDEKEFADYFEKAIQIIRNYKAVANWMLGPVKSWLNENNLGIKDFPLSPSILSSLIALVEEKKLSFSSASSKVLPSLIKNPDADVLKLAKELNVLQESNSDYILPIVEEVLLKFDDKVREYKKGKKGLLALFVGEIMKRSKGKADPHVVNEIVLEKLKS
jgi:aspartyl-tRNA(Asn)/glutamyl-tRNA(Gln) amidotransferase subunit B